MHVCILSVMTGEVVVMVVRVTLQAARSESEVESADFHGIVLVILFSRIL
jgi:hypothetical protein